MALLDDFFRHNTMMNTRVLEACSELAPEQLDATVEGTYGSIGATLVHIANGQEGYTARFFGGERRKPLPEVPFPGFDVVAARLADTDAQLEVAVQRLETEFQVRVTGDDPPGTWEIPARMLLLQAVNHATEHRSQIATILTQLGTQPPPMDGWTYVFDSGFAVEVS